MWIIKSQTHLKQICIGLVYQPFLSLYIYANRTTVIDVQISPFLDLKQSKLNFGILLSESAILKHVIAKYFLPAGWLASSSYVRTGPVFVLRLSLSHTHAHILGRMSVRGQMKNQSQTGCCYLLHDSASASLEQSDELITDKSYAMKLNRRQSRMEYLKPCHSYGMATIDIFIEDFKKYASLFFDK